MAGSKVAVRASRRGIQDRAKREVGTLATQEQAGRVNARGEARESSRGATGRPARTVLQKRSGEAGRTSEEKMSEGTRKGQGGQPQIFTGAEDACTEVRTAGRAAK